jgi:hypothetical protein
LSIPHPQNQDTSLLGSLRTPGQHHLVMVNPGRELCCDITCQNPPLLPAGKNCINDFHILHGHLWGERFQMSVRGERQVTGGNGANPSGRKRADNNWIWKVFSSVISVGSSSYRHTQHTARVSFIPDFRPTFPTQSAPLSDAYLTSGSGLQDAP